MNEFFKKILIDIKDFWLNLENRQKIIIVVVAISLFVGFILLMNWIRQPQYVVLYSNLSPETAGSIVEKLKENNTEYRLARNGTTVEVPARTVYDLRIQMAKDGLPPKNERRFF